MESELRYSTSLSLVRFLVGWFFWIGCFGVGVVTLAATWSLLTDSEVDLWISAPPVDLRLVPVPEDRDVPYSVEEWVAAEPFVIPKTSNGLVRAVDIEDVEASIRLRPTRRLALLAGLPALALGVCWLFGLFLLRGLLRDVDDSRVFTLPNANRIRWIGTLFVLVAMAEPVAQFILAALLRGALEMQGVVFEATFPDLTLILVGLLTLVLSQVWRYGVQLQADRDLTV